MAILESCNLPGGALLGRYRDSGAYTDCYCTVVPVPVPHRAFVEAFYTTPLFRVERALLGWFAGRPSTDAEAGALAGGASSRFCAWVVEGRTPQQLLVADVTGRTRSWLMAAPVGESANARGTRLYFGSAVVPRLRRRDASAGPGTVFQVLLGFHRLYSRLLLAAARKRVLARTGTGST